MIQLGQDQGWDGPGCRARNGKKGSHKGMQSTADLLHQQHSVDHPIIFRAVGDLCVLAPDDLTPWRHQTQFTDIDLNDGPLVCRDMMAW